MLQRIPQPPVNPALRARERHYFWPGFAFALVGLLLALFGLGRITAVEKVTGDLALETEANIAFAHGGVQFAPGESPSETQPEFAVPPSVRPEGLPPETFLPPKRGNLRLCIDLTVKSPCPT